MQGFNMGRYIPPDLEGTKTSANALHRKRAPGQTANGVQTVRFEMPFAIWCTTCPKPTIIGQGVRFNASKSRAGNYHSTPIWRFVMRHADCAGEIEIHTDPKNTAYVVVSGAKKRDHGDDGEGEVAAPVLTDAERDALRKNAFASLEKTIADRQQLARASERIDELADESDRLWADPYAQNQRLRRAFRPGRKERERQAERTGALQDRFGLEFELAPESEEDARRAALVDFGVGEEEEGEEDGGVAAAGDRARAKPLFTTTKITTTTNTTIATKKPEPKQQKKKSALLSAEEKRRDKMAQKKESFAVQVMGNTRASKDPFLSNGGDTPKGPARLPGVKRKRKEQEKEDEKDTERGEPHAKVQAQTLPPDGNRASEVSTSLVDYDSD